MTYAQRSFPLPFSSACTLSCSTRDVGGAMAAPARKGTKIMNNNPQVLLGNHKKN